MTLRLECHRHREATGQRSARARRTPEQHIRSDREIRRMRSRPFRACNLPACERDSSAQGTPGASAEQLGRAM